MKSLLKKVIPQSLILFLHHVNSCVAALWYGLPGTRMYMIGITGTKGKTSVAHFVWSVLQEGNVQTGLIGTANIRIGKEIIPNRMHMTMPGPWTLHRMLRDMYRAGCTHVVMEVTSEGIKQGRHYGIAFCTTVFTNLSPEHLTSHGGSFEKYKQTKGKLFATLRGRKGTFSILNFESEYGEYYSSFKAEKITTFGFKHGDVRASDVAEQSDGVTFTVEGFEYGLRTHGKFNILNALPAIILAEHLGLPKEKIRNGLMALTVIPGRMERIEEGQPYTVIVDYAHEKLSINTLLDTASSWKKHDTKVIVLIGAEGGGRDTQKQEDMGEASGKKADVVIVTTTDPYDDDPEVLAENVASFVEKEGKKRGEDLFVILDRREALTKAFSLAAPGDIVLATGMGAQETMIVRGQSLPWNEREIVRELIRNQQQS
jgi:UDP-N-acetylmuramoyl-L-alanyl-D-glutamate--2,6-diaminopimelate ligase